MSPKDPDNKSALSGFWEFVSLQNDFQAWMAKAALASPLVDLIVNAGPPWPHHGFVITATVVAELVVYVILYEFFRDLDRVRLRRTLVFSTVASCLSAIAYATLFAFFIVPAPDYRNAVVVGYELRPEVAKLYKDKQVPPHRELLEEGGRHEDLVWTDHSLTVARLIVLLAWILLYTFVTALFSTFVLLRVKPKPNGGRS